MNNDIYEGENRKLEKQNRCKIVNNEKNCLKCTSKPSYMPHKIFVNSLDAIRKSKLALKLNKTCLDWNVHIRKE